MSLEKDEGQSYERKAVGRTICALSGCEAEMLEGAVVV